MSEQPEFFTYTRDELIDEFVHPDDRPAVEEARQKRALQVRAEYLTEMRKKTEMTETEVAEVMGDRSSASRRSKAARLRNSRPWPTTFAPSAANSRYRRLRRLMAARRLIEARRLTISAYPPRSATWTRSPPWPTTRYTVSAPGSGPRTSPRPTPWPRRSAPARSGSTATTSSTHPCRSAGTSSPAGREIGHEVLEAYTEVKAVTPSYERAFPVGGGTLPDPHGKHRRPGPRDGLDHPARRSSGRFSRSCRAARMGSQISSASCGEPRGRPRPWQADGAPARRRPQQPGQVHRRVVRPGLQQVGHLGPAPHHDHLRDPRHRGGHPAR